MVGRFDHGTRPFAGNHDELAGLLGISAMLGWYGVISTVVRGHVSASFFAYLSNRRVDNCFSYNLL